MNVGLVRRILPTESAAKNQLEEFVQALKAAGHALVLFTAGETANASWIFGKIKAVPGPTPSAFARAVEAANPHGECDFLFSFEPGVACDCYLAVAGVQRARMAQWSRQKPPGLWRLRSRSRDCDPELPGLEAESFQPGTTNTIVAGSRMVKNDIVRHYNYPDDRILVIHDGIPPVNPVAALEARREARRHLQLDDEGFVIFCGGPEIGELEFRFAIEGINRVDLSQPVLLAGCVENRMAYPRSRRTRFVGPGTRHLAAADLLLQPSVYDPFSHTCLEAIAIGLPVITTAANGFSEIIEPGFEGEILPEPSDVAAIACAIEAWADPSKRRSVKPRLLELASQFDPASNLEALLALPGHCVTT
jgi:UDP-glucose:(heptosyl)LPS alpha-1,3-glucosyltransferase